MKTQTTKTMTLTLLSCVVAGTLLAAQTETKQGSGKVFPGAGELKAYRQKQQKLRREFHEERRDASKKFRESLKESTPSEALPSIISNRETRYSETKTFMNGLHTDFLSYAKDVFAKHEVDAEKVEQFLKKCGERHDEMEAKHDEQHAKVIAALKALQGNEDLSWDQIKEVMQSNKPSGENRRGEGKGERKGKGKRNKSE